MKYTLLLQLNQVLNNKSRLSQFTTDHEKINIIALRE